MKVTTRKTTKSEAKLFNQLIQAIDVLEREKTDEPERENIKDIRKHNILNIVNNAG